MGFATYVPARDAAGSHQGTVRVEFLDGIKLYLGIYC